jgi:hypothetical protein
VGKVGGAFEPVFLDQMQVVALVEDFAAHLRIETTQGPNFAVLLGDELLAHRGDLDVEVLFREKEVGSEILAGPALSIPGNGKSSRLVLPGNSIEIEQGCELPLAVVGKLMGDARFAGTDQTRGFESQEPSAARSTSRSG